MNTLSIMVCSYNTPKVLKTCIKSWNNYHPESNIDWLISENSTNEETAEMLDKHSIPYFRNAGLSHASGVDFLIKQCKTEYALLIDSDVVFRENIEELWNMINNTKFIIAGKRCGDRGGKKLYPRIEPWFCFLNIRTIKEKGFIFGDDDALNKGNQPSDRIWDVGSKIYNDVIKANYNVIDMENDMDSYFYHYEGMSWRKSIPEYKAWGEAVEQAYEQEIERYKDIELKLNRRKQMDLLTELGLKYNTDKAYAHHYTEEYNKILEPIRFEIDSLLEIGVMRGESIRMWLEYFPNAIISCIDINNLSHLFAGNERVKFYQVSQTAFVANEQYDIILDDGSHRMDDQQITFTNLFKNINKYYILEDLQTSSMIEYGFNGNNSTVEFLKRLHEEKKINLNLISTNGGGSLSSFISKV